MTNSNLSFRVAIPDDSESIQQLVLSAFRAEDSRAGWTADMELGARFHIDVDQIMARITNPESEFLLAMNDKETLIASVAVSKRENNSARLAMLAVHPGHHRGGIGRQVLTYAEEYCQRAWAVTRFELDALSTRQALMSWYMRCGYRMTGQSTPFPRESMKDLELPDDLSFIELEKDLRKATVAEMSV